MLQKINENGPQWNGMSLDIRQKYFLSNKMKSSQKRKRRGLLLFKDFYQPVYTESTLSKWTHSHNFKASISWWLSHLWGNGLDIIYSNHLYHLFSSSDEAWNQSLCFFDIFFVRYPFKRVPISGYSLTFLPLLLLTIDVFYAAPRCHASHSWPREG